MTSPYERTRAVVQTREFLRELQCMTEVPQSVREQAGLLLRHYPNLKDLEAAHLGAPDIWGPAPPLPRFSASLETVGAIGTVSHVQQSRTRIS